MTTRTDSIKAIMLRRWMDPVHGICGVHGGHETAELGDVRRADGGRGLRGGTGKIVDRVFLE